MLTRDDLFHAAEKLFGAKDFSGYFGKNLQKAIAKGTENIEQPHFYISVITNIDAKKAGRMWFSFFPRYSCPTPHANQLVYRHSKADQKTELLWALPDPATIERHVSHLTDLSDPMLIKIKRACLSFVNGDFHTKSDQENSKICYS